MQYRQEIVAEIPPKNINGNIPYGGHELPKRKIMINVQVRIVANDIAVDRLDILLKHNGRIIIINPIKPPIGNPLRMSSLK